MNQSQQELYDYLDKLRVLVRQMHDADLEFRDHKLVYYGIGDLLLKHGKWYEAQPKPAIYPRLTIKACFHNARLLAMERGLRYVEGYALSIIPVHHAWCVNDYDKVIEVTWKKPGKAYLGIEFPPPKMEIRNRSAWISPWLEEQSLYTNEWKGDIHAVAN